MSKIHNHPNQHILNEETEAQKDKASQDHRASKWNSQDWSLALLEIKTT